MISTKKIENLIIIIFIIGTLISVSLVIIGGLSFLIQHGFEPLQTNLIVPINKNAATILQGIFKFSSINLINLGLLILVIIQVIRVLLLVWFYHSNKDRWFTFISSYILIILLYGLLFRN